MASRWSLRSSSERDRPRRTCGWRTRDRDAWPGGFAGVHGTRDDGRKDPAALLQGRHAGGELRLVAGFARATPGGVSAGLLSAAAPGAPPPKRGREKGRFRGAGQGDGAARDGRGRDGGRRAGRTGIGPVGGFATRGLGAPVRAGRFGSGPGADAPAGPGAVAERAARRVQHARGGRRLAVRGGDAASGQLRRPAGCDFAPAGRPPATDRPGRDTRPTKVRGHRLVPAGLLVPGARDEAHMPRHEADAGSAHPREAVAPRGGIGNAREGGTDEIGGCAHESREGEQGRSAAAAEGGIEEIAAKPPRDPRTVFPPRRPAPPAAKRKPRPPRPEAPPGPFFAPREQPRPRPGPDR